MTRSDEASGTEAGDAVLNHESLKQAAEWYAVLLEEPASGESRAQWQQWLDASVHHRRAWAEMEAIGRQFEPLQHRPAPQQLAASSALQAVQKNQRVRRNVLRGLVWVPTLGLSGWLAWRFTPLQHAVVASLADHHTRNGQVRELVLADGTRLWLNTASAVDVNYSAGARTLRLLAGEVLVQTAQDTAGRPLLLHTRHGQMQPLGTRFAACLLDEHCRLAVYEGAVRVSTPNAVSAVVQAGQMVRFTTGAIESSVPVDGREPSWVRGVLVVQDMPLAQLAAELERYRHGRISVAPEVAGLRVLGSYPLHDTDAALRLLAQSLPVRVRHVLPWWVVLEPA